MPDHCGVYERITVREYLEFFAAAAGVQAAVVAAVIELTDLANFENQLVASLSKGMRQRLQLARVLLHDPKVLIMDEPASDLDPRARIEIKDLLLELRELGKTIFLSSHILSELSDVCTSIGIIERGELLVAGPIGQIAEQLAERKDAARISERPAAESSRDRPPPSVAPEVRRRVKIRVLADSNSVAPLLPRSPSMLSVEPSPGGWLLVNYAVNYAGDETVVADMVRALVSQGIAIVAVEPERNELERIFLEVTKGSLQ
jgi:ABC-2 type transport system ATP-binding protein